jgi:hypothetical protein
LRGESGRDRRCSRSVTKRGLPSGRPVRPCGRNRRSLSSSSSSAARNRRQFDTRLPAGRRPLRGGRLGPPDALPRSTTAGPTPGRPTLPARGSARRIALPPACADHPSGTTRSGPAVDSPASSPGNGWFACTASGPARCPRPGSPAPPARRPDARGQASGTTPTPPSHARCRPPPSSPGRSGNPPGGRTSAAADFRGLPARLDGGLVDVVRHSFDYHSGRTGHNRTLPR